MTSQLNSQSSPSAHSIPLVLIPAAGFGTRVGSPAAKELFLGPSGSPLIAFGLEQARLRGWPVHVITRKEKFELIQYLQGYRQQTGIQLEIQLIEPSREWPDTLLKSEPYWGEKNLLCLPDTVFEPLEIWDDLATANVDLAAATFKPADFSTWGVFRTTAPSGSQIGERRLWVCEKPQEQDVDTNTFQAWGILCWRKNAGQALLSAQLESGQDRKWRALNMTYKSFDLDLFQDVTRGK
jgi:dTDP-glucose pyrophosphorylase